MAFRREVPCYVCDRRYNPRQMPGIYGPNMANVARIAIIRRNGFRRDPLDIGVNTRICFGCHQSILHDLELEGNPNAIRMDVLVTPGNNSCFICGNPNDVYELSIECKAELFLKCRIYCPPANVRSCNRHLDGRGYIQRPLLNGLQCVNRNIIINPQDFHRLLEVLPTVSQEKWVFNDIYDLSADEVYKLTGMNRENFEELFNNFCQPVPRRGGGQRHVHRKDLLMFLCKMKQGLSDDLLTLMFKYPSRNSTSLAVSTVRQSLMMLFVPQNLGLASINREQYIQQHVTQFANQLYNPNPETPVAIAAIDGTYEYCFKSSNFRSQRQTYCTHKSRNLIKPALVVAPDGFILDVHGPYFSDGQNNDAAMIINELLQNDNLNDWFHEGDILLVDRGYRDAVPLLQDTGFDVRMPPLREEGQNQLSTEDANEARMITKHRWIVEARNGHMKTIFKLLNMVQQVHVLPNIGDFYRIAAAIINRYHPPIIMESGTPELANEMHRRAALENDVQAIVEAGNLTARNANEWIILDEIILDDFPVLTLEYLEDLTVGCYQIGLSPAYVQDKLQRENIELFEVEVLRGDNEIPDPGLVRTRIFSRFQNRVRYQQFILYEPNGRVEDSPIFGYYCTCICGSRTLGTCAHITSVLWYLGYARHEENVEYPSNVLLHQIQDAGMRPLPQDLP